MGNASALINQYDGSLLKIVRSVYPEYEWLPWKFVACPQGFWDNIENQKVFIQWAGKQLKIKEMSDWYKVSQKVYCFVAQVFCNW